MEARDLNIARCSNCLSNVDSKCVCEQSGRYGEHVPDSYYCVLWINEGADITTELESLRQLREEERGVQDSKDV